MFKKSLAILLAASLAVALSGCGKNAPEPGKSQPATSSNSSSSSSSGNSQSSGGSPSSSNTNSNSSATNTQSQPKTYQKVSLGPLKKGDKADVGPVTYTLDEIAAVTGVTGLPQGYVYLVLKLTVKNNGDDDYTINPADHFKVTDPGGKNRPFNIQATGQRNPRLQGTLQKGVTQSGWLGYMVKNDAGTFKFTFNHPDYGDATWEFSIK